VALPAIPPGRIEDPFREHQAQLEACEPIFRSQYIAKVMVSDRQQRGYRTGQRVGLTCAPSRSQLVRLDPPDWPVPRGS
jgi:hypothetical protein